MKSRGERSRRRGEGNHADQIEKEFKLCSRAMGFPGSRATIWRSTDIAFPYIYLTDLCYCRGGAIGSSQLGVILHMRCQFHKN